VIKAVRTAGNCDEIVLNPRDLPPENRSNSRVNVLENRRSDLSSNFCPVKFACMRHTIRVNAIGPGHILTEGLSKMWESNPSSLKFFEQTDPLRRSGTPGEAAAAIAFLCSDDASFVPGAMLMVDGGLTVQLPEHLAARQARYARENPDTQLPFEPGNII
jgi:enoyl-[acyl-carrier-protein] reductase (NADH)